MLDPRQLLLFVTLADTRHFGRTGERLGLAQSTVSMHLRRLEDMLGSRLFTRGAKLEVNLTPVGETFLEEARASLARLEEAEQIGRAAAVGRAGTAAMGYIFSAALSGVLPRLLMRIHRELPLARVQPTMIETPDQIAAVAARRLALGLCRPRPSYPRGVAAKVIHAEPMQLLVACDHPLVSAGAVMARDLAPETFLLPQFDERYGLVEALERLARIAGIAPPTPIRTNDFVTAVSMAAGGYGVVLGPVSLARLGVAGVTAVPIVDFVETIGTVLLWHEKGSPLARTLAACASSGWDEDG